MTARASRGEDICLHLIQRRSEDNRRGDNELSDEITSGRAIAASKCAMQFAVERVRVGVHDQVCTGAEQRNAIGIVWGIRTTPSAQNDIFCVTRRRVTGAESPDSSLTMAYKANSNSPSMKKMP